MADVPVAAPSLIAIDPVEYWRLRTASVEVEQAETQLALAQSQYALAQQRLEQARTRRQTQWTALARQYALTVEGTYQLVDESCSVRALPPSNGARRPEEV